MNTRIYAKQNLKQTVDNAVCHAYERRKRSIDFLLLFPVSQSERETITDYLLQENPLILNIRWPFGTVLFTAYIKD